MLTYDHSVKVNGKWFKAGEVVATSSVLTSEPVKQEAPKPVDNDTKQVAQESKPATPKRSYTKRK